MKTYPLESMTIDEAKELQFKLIDIITDVFKGSEVLALGDLGVVRGLNKPTYTLKVEKVIAKLFNAEAAILLRGAGTGAIRWGLMSFLKPGDRVLLHDAPIYPTTEVTLSSMGFEPIFADFNDTSKIKEVLLENPDVKGAIVQYTRQKIEDSYTMDQVISTIKTLRPELPVLTDDNYAAMKVRKIGVELGADLSAFSSFKLLGPEGVGILVGNKENIDKIAALNYSGGSQVQGHEAMEVIRGLIYAPVSLAISAGVSEELVNRLNSGELKGVKKAFIANAQSKVLLVQLEEEIAEEVIKAAEAFGAAPNPVGAESRYEFVPMFYRVSGTFKAADKALEKTMVRINPMRSGADTVIKILKKSIDCAKNNSI
ncbi:aminotransferase class V-fold PLP-dependent enzyme [Alloiococcus sp. CFN-8]|uniref:aminotransferase class V-fold PLP-dependent enzyme n=1 Tax=Alloiococcus sp. CFN-8 TaxID=3416081 RepID=UPI003CE7CA99